MSETSKPKNTGRLFSNPFSKHPKVVATIEAARLADQSLVSEDEYSKLINDIPLSTTSPPDQSSIIIASPEPEGAAAEGGYDESDKPGFISQPGSRESSERKTVTIEREGMVSAYEVCHRLLGNCGIESDTELQLVPDFYDPTFSANKETATSTEIWSKLKENKSWNNPSELTSLLLADSQVDKFDECSLTRHHFAELSSTVDKLQEDTNEKICIPKHAKACDLSCNFLNQHIFEDQADVKLVPDFFDPFFALNISHMAENSNDDTVHSKDPLNLNLKNLKNAVEMCNYFMGTQEQEFFEDIALTDEKLIETPSIEALKDPSSKVSSSGDKQSEILKGPAYALTNNLLSQHSWVVDDDIRLIPSDAYVDLNHNSEQETEGDQTRVRSPKLSVPKNWANASELSNLLMNGSKIDPFENCTLFMDNSLISDTEENELHEPPTDRDTDSQLKPQNKLSETGKSRWKSAAELCNLLVLNFDTEILPECDLLPKDSLDLYIGAGSSEGNSDEEKVLHRKPRRDNSCGSACNLSSALMELHGLKPENNTQFIPRLHLPEETIQQTRDTGRVIVKRETSTEQDCGQLSKLDEVDAHQKTDADLGSFNKLLLVLEGNLDLYTGGSQSPGSGGQTNFPRHLFCGPGLRYTKPNKRSYLDDAVFIPDFFDPSVLSTIEKRIPNKEGSHTITEINLEVVDEVSERLLTEARLSSFNKFTVILDSKLDLCIESCETYASSPEDEHEKAVLSNDKVISKGAPGMADYLIGTGLSTMEDDVSLISEQMKDPMVSPSGIVSTSMISDGDEQTTLYEATLIPGLNASQLADQVIQHIGYPFIEDYRLVGDMELTMPFWDSFEVNDPLNQTQQQDEQQTRKLTLISENGAARLDQKGFGKQLKKMISPDIPAAEIADKISVFNGLPAEDVAVSLIDNASSWHSSREQMNEAALSPISTQSTPARPSKSGISAAELACHNLDHLIDIVDSNTTLINNFDDLLDFSYPEAELPESTNSSELNFVPVSAAEIAARIDKSFGCSTWEDLRLVGSNLKRMVNFDPAEVKHMNKSVSSAGTNAVNKAVVSKGVPYRAPDVASMLLDQGIAVFDGDTPFVPSPKRPVGQCVVDRSFTLEIPLKTSQKDSTKIHAVEKRLADAKIFTLQPNSSDPSVQTLTSESLHPIPRTPKEPNIHEKTLTPSQVKIVRIRRRKSSEQEDIMTPNDSPLPRSEKRIKYYTTREVQLDFLRPQNYSLSHKLNRSKSLGKNDRISVTWSESTSKSAIRPRISFEKSFRPISPVRLKNQSKTETLKQMNSPNQLLPLKTYSKTPPPEVLHIYTSQSTFSVQRSMALDNNRRDASQTAASIHMGITSPVNYSNEILSIPQPFESPLPYKVYTDDEDSDKSTVSSRSGYFIEVTK